MGSKWRPIPVLYQCRFRGFPEFKLSLTDNRYIYCISYDWYGDSGKMKSISLYRWLPIVADDCLASVPLHPARRLLSGSSLYADIDTGA